MKLYNDVLKPLKILDWDNILSEGMVKVIWVDGVLEPLDMALGHEKDLDPLIWWHDHNWMMIWKEGHDREEHGTWTHLETC